MFEIQVQGRFKRPPEGDLYISLEITDRMKLGLLAKVCMCRPFRLVCFCLFGIFFVGLIGFVGFESVCPTSA